jgi:hypothetical protein
MLIRSIYGGLILAALCGPLFAADIRMGPTGDDQNDGSAGKPVATLQRAVDLALSNPKARSEPMRVLVQQGTYRGQKVQIDGSKLVGELAIVGLGTEPADFPVFRGDGSKATWFTLKSDTGKPTGLTIQAIAVHDYFAAISLEGNREDRMAFNSGTTIRRNIFRNIGSATTHCDDCVSFAAILFYNSQNNLVENNFFGTIRNKRDKDCGSLHSIYLAHFSSDNRIVDNTFQDVCGSAIKLRDRSNNNRIEGNRFKEVQNAPAIEEWFCDADARKDCTKKSGECPSTGNVASGNDLSGSPGTQYISIVGDRTPRAWCSAEDFARERMLSK